MRIIGEIDIFQIITDVVGDKMVLLVDAVDLKILSVWWTFGTRLQMIQF